MWILLNGHSNNGRGLRRWRESRSELETKFLGREYRVEENPVDLAARLREEYARGERVFVAAGGDGTVNYLLNAIMTADGIAPAEITLGAIGLGSSNDFQKPYSADRRTRAGVPFRLDAARAVPHNVGRVDYQDATGRDRSRFFVINGSLGIIARGNYLFNSDERLVRWLKPKWVAGTIWYLTLRTLLSSKNIPLRLAVADDRLETEATTLSVILNPHFTGNLSYDCGDYSRKDAFGVALCERMGTTERLRTLSSLTKARFRGLPKTRFWESPAIEIDPAEPTPFEMDGEVVLAKKIRVQLVKGALKTCP
jgi:diacylglycerol kinase (ATP)